MDPKTNKGPISPSSREGLSKRLRILEEQYVSKAEALRVYSIAKTTYDKWIKGTSSPSVENLANIAEISGVTLDWLVFGESDVPEQKIPIESSHNMPYTAIDRTLMGKLTEDILILSQNCHTDLSSDQLMEHACDIYDSVIEVEGLAKRDRIVKTMMKLLEMTFNAEPRKGYKTPEGQQSA